jgi:PII-like signaling protein
MLAYRLPVIVEVLDEGERAFNGIGSHCRVVEDPCG